MHWTQETPMYYHHPVLDKGFVGAVNWMSGDTGVIRAARICYQSKARNEDSDRKLIRRLLKSDQKHNTVFEHAVFTFKVKCPIFVARQWLRHRIGSFNEKSLRYCVADREYYVPYGANVIYAAEVSYAEHMEASFDVYERLVENGMAKEQARGVLGTAIYTEFLWTVNAWSLMNWIQKRINSAAQWEHQQYAKAVLEIFASIMPITANAFKEFVLKQ